MSAPAPFRPSWPKAYAACRELHGSCGCEERKSDPCSSWIPVLRRAHALGRDDIVAMERERMAQEKSAEADGL